MKRWWFLTLVPFLILTSVSFAQSKGMHPFGIQELNESQRLRLADMIRTAIVAAGSQGTTKLKDVQGLYDLYLGDEKVQPSDAASLGALFGEFVGRMSGWRWMNVHEDDIDEISLVYFADDGRKYVVHPISMITRRLLEKRAVDLRDLLDAIIDKYEAEFGQFRFQ